MSRPEPTPHDPLIAYYDPFPTTAATPTRNGLDEKNMLMEPLLTTAATQEEEKGITLIPPQTARTIPTNTIEVLPPTTNHVQQQQQQQQQEQEQEQQQKQQKQQHNEQEAMKKKSKKRHNFSLSFKAKLVKEYLQQQQEQKLKQRDFINLKNREYQTDISTSSFSSWVNMAQSGRLPIEEVVALGDTGMGAKKRMRSQTPNSSTTRKCPRPTNSLVTPLLTDLYQITMSYAYYKTNKYNDPSIFELFFRKNPFGGEYTIFCGLDEVLKHISNFSFSKSDLDYLRSTPSLQHCDPLFFDEYLAKLDCSSVRVWSMKEGTMAFPRVPLMVIEGPLGVCQLLETTLLSLVNYPSLVATNAARMVVAARGLTENKEYLVEDEGIGDNKKQKPKSISSPATSPKQPSSSSNSNSNSNNNNNNNNNNLGSSLPQPRCVEFGLRRAQGPDGGFSASKYSFVGGFDATSNVQAGKILDIPISGTHAHAFVQSHSSLEEAASLTLPPRFPREEQSQKQEKPQEVNLLQAVLKYRTQILPPAYQSTNDGELAAFLSYAASFPNSFLCLIDTYDTLRSGLLNFIMVSLVLDDLGYEPRGIRLDSGDLAYLSAECHKMFHHVMGDCSKKKKGGGMGVERDFFRRLDIVASNDINEEVLHCLNRQGHRVTVFGIGTNLVTCQAQPSLGCVYKLVEISGKPRMKLSQDFAKVLIPGKKVPYRLFGEKGWPLLDIMMGPQDDEEENHPVAGRRVLCRHPFVEQKRVAVTAERVEMLHVLVFDREKGVVVEEPSLTKSRKFVADQIKRMRPDILRHINPGQYKVSVSDKLFKYLHQLWQTETPVVELH